MVAARSGVVVETARPVRDDVVDARCISRGCRSRVEATCADRDVVRIIDASRAAHVGVLVGAARAAPLGFSSSSCLCSKC